MIVVKGVVAVMVMELKGEVWNGQAGCKAIHCFLFFPGGILLSVGLLKIHRIRCGSCAGCCRAFSASERERAEEGWRRGMGL